MEDRLKEWLKTIKLNESTISMLLGGLVVVVVGVLIYNYFTSIRSATPVEQATGEVELVEEDGKIVPKALPTTHTVEAGESLWSIAQQYYTSGYNWVDVSRENNLANSNYLQVGQELTIPKSEVINVGESAEDLMTGRVIEGSSYQVQKGDSLWSIAVRAYQDGYRWTDIANVNRNIIPNPNLIDIDLLLKLPR